MKNSKHIIYFSVDARHQLKSILDSVDDIDTMILEISIEEPEPGDYPDVPNIELKCITEARIY